MEKKKKKKTAEKKRKKNGDTHFISAGVNTARRVSVILMGD